ncbi:MAG: hypothetical protein ABR985_10545 [Methanotrichaceae archaeon]
MNYNSSIMRKDIAPFSTIFARICPVMAIDYFSIRLIEPPEEVN